MKPMLKKLRADVLKNKALCALLAHIQENRLISDAELLQGKATLQLQVNLLGLFEAFALTMANSHTLSEDIFKHILHQRNSISSGNPIANFLTGAPKEATLFERLKMISVDPAMADMSLCKSVGEKPLTPEDIKEFTERHQLSGLNASINSTFDPSFNPVPGNVGLNVLEAAWEDATQSPKGRGHHENALTGIALICLLEKRQYRATNKRVSHILPCGVEQKEEDTAYSLLQGLKINTQRKLTAEISLDAKWRDLYNTWNLFFVKANLDSVFLPIKLLVPSVFSATPENYLDTRVMTLFLMGNLFLSQQVTKNPFFQSQFNLERSDDIFRTWGNINQKYAESVLQSLCPDTKLSLRSVFNNVFGDYTTFNFIRHITSFVRDRERFFITPYGKAHQYSLFTRRSGWLDITHSKPEDPEKSSASRSPQY
jgi:hypothetical protein